MLEVLLGDYKQSCHILLIVSILGMKLVLLYILSHNLSSLFIILLNILIGNISTSNAIKDHHNKKVRLTFIPRFMLIG
jgi:hypothetical protein